MRTRQVLIGSLLAVVLQAVFFAGTLLAFDVSGTLEYAGTKTGRVFLSLPYTEIGTLGTSLVSDGSGTPLPFTIRGVPNGNYTLKAFMDTQGVAVHHQSDPIGSIDLSVSDGNVSGLVLTLTDPSAPAPDEALPAHVSVVHNSNAAMINWSTSANNSNNGPVPADTYNLYWSTDPDVMGSYLVSGGSITKIAASNDKSTFIHTGIGATIYHYAMKSVVNGVLSGSHASETATTTGAGSTITGQVSLSGGNPLGKPLCVFVGTGDAGPTNFTALTTISTSQTFTITGVPDGDYWIYPMFDMNENGLLDTGDIGPLDSFKGQAHVAGGNVDAGILAFSSRNMNASVMTNFWKNGDYTGYNLNFNLRSNKKIPVKVTFTGGTNMPGPLAIDAGLSEWGDFQNYTNIPWTPHVGDSYTFDVTYSDDTTQTVSRAVTNVLDSFATPVSPLGVIPYGTGIPAFTWSAPSSPPAGGYTYRLSMWGESGWWWPNEDLLSTQLSAVYNFDNSASQPMLTDGRSYRWRIEVRDINGNSASNESEFIYITPATGVTLAPSAASPQVQGTQVTFTAQAINGSGDYEYQFRIKTDTTWSTPQAWDPSNTFNWTPAQAGSYTIQVRARNVGSTAVYEASRSVTYVVVEDPPVTGVSLTANQQSPALSTFSTVQCTAVATGGTGTYQYKFMVKNSSDNVWTTPQDWDSSNTFDWTPDQVGSYTIQVRARNAGSIAAYEASRNLTFTVVNEEPVTAVSLAVTNGKNSPAVIGTIQFTAEATGTTGGYEYEYRVKNTAGTSGATLREYSAEATFDWTPSEAGIYTIQVRARNAGSLAAYEASRYLAFTVVENSPVTAVSLVITNGKKSPGDLGAIGTVQFSAAATGTTNNYEYLFMVKNSIDNVWITLQDWSGSGTFPWTPTEAGSYTIQVRARNVGSSAAYETYQKWYFKITNNPVVAITPMSINILLPGNSPQTFTLSNVGSQASMMEYHVADDGALGGFLDVQNASGTLAGGTSATITVSVKPGFTATGNGSLVGATLVLNVYTPAAINYVKVPVSVHIEASSSYVISGRVAASDGTGQPGAQVVLSGTASTTVVTDASGFYQFTDLASGPYTITAGYGVAANGYSPGSRAITITTADITGQDFASPLPILYGAFQTIGTGYETGTGGCSSYGWNGSNPVIWVYPGMTIASIQDSMSTAIFSSNSRPDAPCIGTSDLLVQDATHWSLSTTCTRVPGCGAGGSAVATTNDNAIWTNP